MQKILSTFLLSVCVCFGIAANVPDWVTTHPISDKEYVGIGMASVSDADYMKKATQNALADISSQIAVKVENNSFLHLIDVDGKSRDMFEDKIKSSLAAWLEGQELKDTYKTDKTYYVYYVLYKDTYARNAESRRKHAIQSGLDYLHKGQNAENTMNLSQAVQLYGKGLETVEPWVFMNLTTIENGHEINIPSELYSAYVNVFSNMAITTNVTLVEGESFKAVPTPIAGCLSKNGNVIPNVKLKAEFISGSGAVSDAIETDHTGTAEFYITNITSKDKVQEVRISIDDSFLNSLPKAYKQLLKNQAMPSAKVTIQLKNSPVTAYIHISDDNDLEGIERQLRSLFTNNHFVVTEDPDAAQCFIEISSVIENGNTVTGGSYDLNTCYCTLTIKIYNNKSEQLLLDYSVDRVKVLSPVHKKANETIAQCIREVMKRVNRNLPNQIKKLNLN